MPKKKEGLTLILSSETSKKSKYGKGFREIQMVKIQKEEIEKGKSYLEDYISHLRNLSFEQRINLILNSIGKSKTNLLYEKMMTFMKLLPLLENNIGIFIVGQKSLSKSSIYSLVFPSLCKIKSNLGTRAWLAGMGTKEVSDNEKVPLEMDTLIFEEVSEETDSDVKEVIEYLKNTIESGEFLKNNKKETKTTTSFAMIGNNNSDFSRLKDMSREKLLGHLPNAIRKNEAFFDRFPFILPHYREIIGEPTYIEEDIEIIPVEVLLSLIRELRQKEIFSDIVLDMIEKEKLNGRNCKILSKVVSMMGKILFPEKIESCNFDSWFIKGVVEFALHFRSLTEKTEVYLPFNANSSEFIVRMLGFSKAEIEWVMLDEERIIIKEKEKEYISKIALTAFGLKQNVKEYEFYKNAKSDVKNQIMQILSIVQGGKILKQEVGKVYSSKIVSHSVAFPEINQEKNSKIIEDIQASVDRTRTVQAIEDFIGIPDFIMNIMQNKAKESFGSKNIQLRRFQLSVVEKKVYFLNFSEFVEM